LPRIYAKDLVFLEIGSSGYTTFTLDDINSFDICRSNNDVVTYINFESKSNEIFNFKSNLNVENNLTVQGDFSVEGNLHLSSNINISGSQTIQEYLIVQDYITCFGNVGISNNLSVKGFIETNQCLTLSNQEKNTYWKIFNDFNTNIESSELVLVSNSGTTIAFTDTLYESVLNFTASHRTSTIIDKKYYSEDLIGKIVVSTGLYSDLDNSSIIRIDEAVPIVELSTIEKDTTVFGVIAGFEEPDKDTRQFKVGNMVFNKNKEKNDIKLIVNSSGEGALLVCNYNGSIKNGDLLCTSPISGLAMRQDDDIIRSYTIGKATCNTDFEKIYPKSKHGLKTIQFKKKKYKKVLIGVIYMC
jgi:hypothetical protein